MWAFLGLFGVFDTGVGLWLFLVALVWDDFVVFLMLVGFSVATFCGFGVV